jgi:thiol:disulfide interchange protein DsbD
MAMHNALAQQSLRPQLSAQSWRVVARFTTSTISVMRWCALLIISCLFMSFAHADEDYLPPDVAFKMSATMVDAKTVAVNFAIADGYYLYRERFAFKASRATLGAPIVPPGIIKFDETFQKDVETYHKALTITIPVEASGPFMLTVTSQGCAEKGLCYPPMETQIELNAGAGSTYMSSPTGFDKPAAAVATMPESEAGKIEQSLKSGKLLTIIPLFLLLGLGLAFTPCVLPMLPILSSIIVGEGKQVKRSRGFALAAVYSLGMAIVYTALGVAAGLIGEGLSAALQNAWVLGAFAILMIALALSMFDVYQLQMPASIQTRLTQFSDKQTAGKMIGVFVMGAISALIVGPCVAAPLAGALVYISQTRNVVIGGSALFAMAVGMSVPLLLIGLSAGSLLPRAGAWMDSVKRFFGVLMLAVALWMVSPVIPPAVQMIGWSVLGIGYGAYLLWGQRGGWISKAIGLIFAIFGALQLVGLALGNRDPWMPLAHLAGPAEDHVQFKRIKTVQELDAVLAQSAGKHVMLDFYADWCVSCIEMERFTFTDPRVRAQMADIVLLQVDVTKNDVDDKAMLKRFNLFGPPGIIFFDKAGREISGGRVIGFQNADQFTQSLNLIRQF